MGSSEEAEVNAEAKAGIADALENLESGTLKTRAKGLEDLRRVFTNTTRLDLLSDDVFHFIVENLFRIVKTEKQKYVRAVKGVSRNTLSSILTTTASALRIVVEVASAAPNLKHRTISAILDHIIDSLPAIDEGFCKPIEHDYLKCLRAILDVPWQGERLRAKQWQTYVDFVVESISQDLTREEPDSLATQSRAVSASSSRPGKRVAIRGSQASDGQGTLSIDTTATEDLLQILVSLTSIPNAPLKTRLPQIAETLLAWMDRRNSSMEAAFRVLNNLLPLALAEDLQLAATTFRHVSGRMQQLLRDTKITGPKEQILISLFYFRHIYMHPKTAAVAFDASLLDSLIYALWSDSERRNEREMLQLDDLSFVNTSNPPPLSMTGILLSSDAQRSTINWTTLSVLSFLLNGLEKSRREQERLEDRSTMRKRRKLENSFEDVFWRIFSGSIPSRIFALQAALFLMETITKLTPLMIDCVCRLENNLNEDDLLVTGWTFIVLARSTKFEVFTKPEYRDWWQRIWVAASRASNTSACSRSASYVMTSMLRSGIAATLMTPRAVCDSIFSDGGSGPALFSEAALQLLIAIMESGLLDNERAFKSFASRSLSWLESRWSLPTVPDKLHNSRTASFGQPFLLYRFLLSAMGKEVSLNFPTFAIPSGVINRAAYIDHRNLQSTVFMTQESLPLISAAERHAIPLQKRRSLAGQAYLSPDAVADLLLFKLRSFEEAWKALANERSAYINADVIEIVSSACALTALVLPTVQNQVTATALETANTIMWNEVCGFSANASDDSREEILTRIAARLLQVKSSDADTMHNFAASRVKYVAELRSIIMNLPQASGNTLLEEEIADSFNTRTPQNSQLRSNKVSTARDDRLDLPQSLDYRLSLLEHNVMLKLDMLHAQNAYSIDADDISVFITELSSINGEDLFLARTIFDLILTPETLIRRTDAAQLVKKVGEICLSNLRLDRCEAALCLCLRVLTNLVQLWTSDEDNDDELAGSAYDLYEWFVEVAVGKSVASVPVLRCMSILLEAVLKANASYAVEELPSPRTVLFQILSKGSTNLKFDIAPIVSTLFEGYILSEHAAIFDDVVDSLPSDPDDIEGIIVRLYTLAFLGSRWQTILRQAVYHIFETTGKVPAVSVFAVKCVRLMCEYLHIEDIREVFRMFSSQIFYTWLETESIEMIPFATFGYQTLTELLRDVQDELVAQIVLRASSQHAQKLVQYLGASWDSLVEPSFSKAIAYAIIADTTIHRSPREVGKSESFLLEHLSEEQYAVLFYQQFPDILATTLLRLSDDTGFEKSAIDGTKSDDSIEAYRQMCSYSSSQTLLPPGQQPSFRAKNLLHILNKLSSHAEVQTKQLWRSSMLTSVFRSLLDDAKSAFGPLHACATFRKIRVVLSIAGSDTLTGYPLEMLLHNVTPFLTQFHCSEDVVGIVWYLLEQGRDYFQLRLPFIAGLGVAMFASLSRFVHSSQDSTTQEAHFIATITKALDFRKWLGIYLKSFKPNDLALTTAESFRNIVDAAKEVTKVGNSNKSTGEGSLLQYLILDQACDQPLLKATTFRHIVQILCHEFESSMNPTDDILSNDEDLNKAVPVLWTLIRNKDIQDDFRVWVAQSLGRAYALLGPEIAVHATPRHADHAIGQDHGSIGTQGSYSTIIEVLINILWGSNRESASQAENTLQRIFSSISAKDKNLFFGAGDITTLFMELRFEDFACPKAVVLTDHHSSPRENVKDTWALNIAGQICESSGRDPVLSSLKDILKVLPSLVSQILPSMIHLVLISSIESKNNAHETLSKSFSDILGAEESFSQEQSMLVLRILIYLRRCTLPSEISMAQRNGWLSVDYKAAANAACKCGMYNIALLMLEIFASQQALTVSRSSKRSSGVAAIVPQDVLAKIYQNVDDPDFFYGTTQEADVQSIVQKLCHERAGSKALSFQSALFDSDVRNRGLNEAFKALGLTTVGTLNLANLHGLARAVQQSTEGVTENIGDVLFSAPILNLDQWDINNQAVSIYSNEPVERTMQAIASAARREDTIVAADEGVLQLARRLMGHNQRYSVQESFCSSLAVLAEIKSSMSTSGGLDTVNFVASRFEKKSWYGSARFENSENILLGGESFAATIKKSPSLRNILKLTPQHALLLEIEIVRASLAVGHLHDMSQFCLNRAAYMSELQDTAEDLNLKVDAAIKYDMASTFWAQDESSASIRILEALRERKDLEQQAIMISQSEILTDLGQKLTKARLDRPDEVTSEYLQPAIAALGKDTNGSKAGRVYHNFAAFCDQQLRDPDNLDEFHRIEKLRNRKKQEVEELETLKRSKEGRERDQIRGHLAKAQTWFKLDDQEWKRLRQHREQLISQCIENYLRAMRACDDFPNDVLRFLALWLEQSQNEDANLTAGKYLPTVPSYKFAPLMNQLSSRVLDNQDSFQKTLYELMFRLCNEHPYHSLYQVFATSKFKGQKNDTVATSRHNAAIKLSEVVMKKGSARPAWISIHNSNIAFVRVAQDKISDRDVKAGSKLQLRKLAMGAKLEQAVQDLHQKIPPPTMKIPLRLSGDYSTVPTLAKFEPFITIAGGISAPKIVTAVASDGSRFKMLLKGGNDDLRQDSIMEQVFEQVSNLLKDSRATRQRSLSIRTYKVIPLTHNAGVIEFVKGTIPLHDYVLPAHERYYPKDFKPGRCRKEISSAQAKSLNHRLQAYNTVATNFHPVMRFFFMEYFLDPDEWFTKRLNYSRSTAAISILGHILGLGDRHGHNILLDTNSGEVVHIDLGVAFEAGRVLPVPEVVPFRLTRDLVDAMGISGVEGVFRRCCNFTLEALRQNQEAIMTLLDVLRWDPLYSWTISPLRLQRMQENQEQAANAAAASGTSNLTVSTATSEDGVATPTAATAAAARAAEDVGAINRRNNDMNEPSEADRALAVVAKKLGKSLSVEATVNDLIRQATDERNLAVLYCGWAAYA